MSGVSSGTWTGTTEMAWRAVAVVGCLLLAGAASAHHVNPRRSLVLQLDEHGISVLSRLNAGRKGAMALLPDGVVAGTLAGKAFSGIGLLWGEQPLEAWRVQARLDAGNAGPRTVIGVGLHTHAFPDDRREVTLTVRLDPHTAPADIFFQVVPPWRLNPRTNGGVRAPKTINAGGTLTWVATRDTPSAPRKAP